MASLNHGISCPFKVGQEQASVQQQQHSPSLPSIAPGVTEKNQGLLCHTNWLCRCLGTHPGRRQSACLFLCTAARKQGGTLVTRGRKPRNHAAGLLPGNWCLQLLGREGGGEGGKEGLSLSPSLSLTLMASSSAKGSFGASTRGEGLKQISGERNKQTIHPLTLALHI